MQKAVYLTSGEAPCLFKLKEKSAEVIVVADTSLCPLGTRQEVSQNSEGPNVKLLPIQ